MPIQPNIVYSINEVSEILKINTRRLQRVGKKYKIEKVDNRYIFKGSFLLIVFADIIKALSQGVVEVSQDIEPLLAKIQELEQQLSNIDIEPLLSKIKALENEIGALKMQLSIYEIEDNEVMEVFTKDEYKLFETRLIEWRYQQKEIEQKALEIQDIKTTAKEDVAHYKNLFEYQRKQSDRILEMHEKLIVTIGEQTQSSIQRNHIEAKDKNYL
jgi:nicotinamide mononucleotide adenylyltransferase